MAHIDYYLATISPNVYNAGLRLERIAKKHGATVTYRPIDLGAVFAQTGGTPLGERHEGRRVYRLQELARHAVLAGHPINVEPLHFPTNPAPSSYAVVAAQNTGGGDIGALVYALAKACWADQENIADDDVIRACLSESGFDPTLVDSGMLTGADAYARNTEIAISAGVFGVPFYITDGDVRFWGQDRLEMLDKHLAGEL